MLRKMLLRLQLAWNVLWHGLPKPEPLPPWYYSILWMLESDTYQMVEKAVNKQIPDKDRLKGAEGEALRKDVQEWSKRYGRELKDKNFGSWEVNFLLEFVIGQQKGLL